jgi:ABC-2 type transport system ATP-binding protein
MRILAGYLSPDSGKASVCGIDIREDPIGAKRMIGYLPETFPVYPEMRVAEYLRFVADMRGLPATKRRGAIQAALESCGIEDVRACLLGSLSRGYRQRLGLAQAILHDPPVLILDEPTAGLDPIQNAGIRDLIRGLGSSKTVLLSTHILPEAQAICSGILVLAGGRLVGESSSGLSGLIRAGEDFSGMSRTGGMIRLRVKQAAYGRARQARQDGTPAILAETLSRELGAVPGIHRVRSSREEGGIFDFELDALPWDEGESDSVLRSDHSASGPEEGLAIWAASSGWLILGLSREGPTLEDVFAGLAGKKGMGEESSGS